MNKSNSIIYVNFSPYENTGKILDYISSQYKTVFLFSFNFYHLGRIQKPSRLQIIHNRKIHLEYKIHLFIFPRSLVFLLLPIRSLTIFIQIVWHVYWLKKTYGPIDVYFSVNAFTSWIGILLRQFGWVNRTIFWVWDYYPPVHKNSIISLIRWFYWWFDKSSSTRSDKVVFLNKRLQQLRADIGILSSKIRYTIVPIGTNPSTLKCSRRKLNNKITLVFLGVVKKSQGLEYVFDSCKELDIQKYPISLEIIGSGPDLEHMQKMTRQLSVPVIFHGYIPDEKKIASILRQSTIGIATYIPEDSNVSYYGDPSKIKTYLSAGLPVITTNVFEFYQEIDSSRAGIIVDYGNKKQFERAIGTIINEYQLYSKHAQSLAKKFYYKKIYPPMFAL